ncbi:MAG: HEAT repeat domain-containing protein [Planctomycetaceae bacterium]
MFRPANWFVLFAVLTTCFAVDVSVAHADDGATGWTPPSWVMSPNEIEDFKREKSRPDSLAALKSRSPSQTQQDFGKRITRYYLSQLLLPENQDLPRTVIDKFLLDVFYPSISDEMRNVLLDEAVAQVPTLMDHPDPVVRVNAINLLNHCSITKPGAGINAAPPQPYVRSMVPLIAEATNQSQQWIVRNMAIVGLARILRDGNPSTADRSKIAEALLKALKDAEGELWWFRWQAVEALGYAERHDLTTGQPAIIEALLVVLSDKKEHFLVRSQAALSISRIPWPAGVNDDLIMEKVADLLVDMSAAQAKQPSNPVWRRCFVSVYLAFRPSFKEEAVQKKWGFLFKSSPASPAVTKLWKVAFPILKPFVSSLDPPAVPQASQNALKDHLGSTKVQNRKVHPASNVNAD